MIALLATSGEKAQLVFARSADLSQDMNALLKQTPDVCWRTVVAAVRRRWRRAGAVGMKTQITSALDAAERSVLRVRLTGNNKERASQRDEALSLTYVTELRNLEGLACENDIRVADAVDAHQIAHVRAEGEGDVAQRIAERHLIGVLEIRRGWRRRGVADANVGSPVNQVGAGDLRVEVEEIGNRRVVVVRNLPQGIANANAMRPGAGCRARGCG